MYHATLISRDGEVMFEDILDVNPRVIELDARGDHLEVTLGDSVSNLEFIDDVATFHRVGSSVTARDEDGNVLSRAALYVMA